jgi:hypothetical protein
MRAASLSVDAFRAESGGFWRWRLFACGSGPDAVLGDGLRRHCLLGRRSDADECFDASDGSGIATMDGGGAAGHDSRRQGSLRSFSARARRAAFLQAHGHPRSETARIVGVRPEKISVWKRNAPPLPRCRPSILARSSQQRGALRSAAAKRWRVRLSKGRARGENAHGPAWAGPWREAPSIRSSRGSGTRRCASATAACLRPAGPAAGLPTGRSTR